MTEFNKPPVPSSELVAPVEPEELSYEYLFGDPVEKIDPSRVTEVVPGVVYNGDMHKHTIDMRQSRLWHLQEDEKTVAKYGGAVFDWLQKNETESVGSLNDIPAPQSGGELVSGVRQQVLDLFPPRERSRRKLDGVDYTTGRLLDALTPGKQGEESFVKKVLPSGLHIGDALVVFDKDQRYRDVVAAACYKVMDQLADEGLLDSYERVKDNRDYKTVSHGDPAITRGRNRDVVTGMVLDMLSGRFNADENRKTSESLGDNDRDGRGVFRGGHHSGAAYQVMHILTDPSRYDHYFGSAVMTAEEKLREALSSKDFIKKVNTITPDYQAPEVQSYSQLPGEVEAHMQGFEFTPQHYNEVVIDPGSTGRPISLTRTLESDANGKVTRGLLVRDVARSTVVRGLVLAQAGEMGVRLSADELTGMVSQFSRMAGIEKFIPEGVEASIGRDQASTMPLPEAGSFVSRNHAVFSVDQQGKIVVRDTSTNGSTIRYR